MKSKGRHRLVAGALGGAAILLVSLSAATSARAAEEDVVAEAPADGWTFEVAPYLWLPEMQGTLSAGRVSAPIDVDFDQLFDLLFDGELLAGGLHLGAQWGRLSLFVDGFGGGARPSQQTQRGKAELTLNFAFIEFGPAYRVLDLPSPKPGGRSIQVDALVGGRFMYFYDSIGFRGTRGRINFSSDATTTWVDPFVGGRWRVPLIGELDMVFRGDIGGFDAGSKLAWNLIGGFQYGLPWRAGESRVSLVAAYKAFDFDYEGSGGRQGRLALNLRGPLLGAMFTF
jgi:hypothetical protein